MWANWPGDSTCSSSSATGQVSHIPGQIGFSETPRSPAGGKLGSHIKARRDLSTISGAMNIGVSQAIRVELPAVSYLVCASQRSGTTMLCRALADIGTAGRPEEYFLAVDEVAQPGWRCWEHGPYGMANGARSREEYLEIVYRLGSTPNGIFGAKLMWNNVPWAVAKFKEVPRFSGLDRAEVFHAAFPGLRIVNITRRDRLRQAVDGLAWRRMASGWCPMRSHLARGDAPSTTRDSSAISKH